MSNTETSTTTVQEVEMALESFGLAGPGNVVTQPVKPEDKKPGFFSQTPDNMSFIDNQDPVTEELTEEQKKAKEVAEAAEAAAKAAGATPSTEDLFGNTNLSEEEKEEAEKQAGRPKNSKEVMVTVVNKLIEKGSMLPFNEDKKIEDYTAADLEELIEANFKAKEDELRKQTPIEFFDSLPQEMQLATKYILDGGKDLKSLFRSLAHVEEVKELDPATPEGQYQIVRKWLQITKFGTDQEIEKEINAWKDREELEEKALQFKPKVDAKQEEIITEQLKAQEVRRKQEAEQSKKWTESIYNTLVPAEINGIKIDKKVQGMLFHGLTQPNYPSISGRQTNLLGHLLEKYQITDPNHSLIAEALWLLQDPDGYREKVRENAKKAVVEDTTRKLKTEQSRSSGSASTQTDLEDETKNRKKPGLERPANNFFKRP